MPLHVPVPAVALEGDYLDWTLQWTITPSYGSRPNKVSFDEASGYAYLAVAVTGDLYRYALADGSETLIVSSQVGIMAQTPIMSILGKYCVDVDKSGATCVVKIIKNGTVIKSISTPNNIGSVDVFIASSGEYILVNDGQANTLRCYKGS